jgi:hypothetical protein
MTWPFLQLLIQLIKRLTRTIFGSLICHFIVLMGLWAFGPLGLWAFGPLGLWAFGPLGLWAFGPFSANADHVIYI